MKRIIFLLLLFFVLPSSVFANSDFGVRVNVTYKVREDGSTTVTENFDLKNLKTEVYPTEYVINVGDAKIAQMKAYDQRGVLNISEIGNKKVKVTFHDAPVGIDKIYSFSVVYEASDIARRVGRVWEVSIPKPTEGNNFTVGLYVPDSFGNIVYSKPKPSLQGLIWTENEFKTNGISIVFDPIKAAKVYQSYDFNLKYHLYNSRLYPVTMEVALPPDTSYQKIFINEITPKPIDVKIDNDGNWLASYRLGSAASLDIVATGSAAVFMEPILSKIRDGLPEDYVKQLDLWKVNSIKRNDPKNIYDFVSTYLRYDTKHSGRKGASAAFNNRWSAICLDFADLFVGLTRAEKISARELEGYAYTSDSTRQPSSLSKDLLHAWAEYYDKVSRQWIMVDPTWANTTGGGDYFSVWDLSHIVFAIHGINEKTPIPAGAYKTETVVQAVTGQKTKDVEIIPVNQNLDVNLMPRIGFRAEIPKIVTAGWEISGKIFVDNLGPTIHSSEKIIMSSADFDVVDPILETGILPPFASRELDVKVRPLHWFNETNGIIELEINGETRNYPVKVRPIFKSNFVVVVTILLILGGISLIAQIIRGLSLQKRKG